MAKKNVRKPSGAAGMAVVDETSEDLQHETNGDSDTPLVSDAKRSPKAKKTVESTTGGHFAVSDIKKAAAFVNSVGGLDKAIAVLQILKVAKDVQ